MPVRSSAGSDSFGEQRLRPGEGEEAAGQSGGSRRALHGVVKVHHDLAARAVEAAERKVDTADDHGQHVVEIVRDAASELADRLHLLDLTKLGFGGLALGRFLLQGLVGVPKLLRSFAYCDLQRFGTFGFRFRLFSGSGILPERLEREHAEEDGAARRPRFRASSDNR